MVAEDDDALDPVLLELDAFLQSDDAYAAHATMSKQALDSERVREGLKNILLGPAELYEALRAKVTGSQPIV
jgi:hypothetical protein